MPIEKGKRQKDWHCSICGRVYMRRDSTQREVLNAWWAHMRENHPQLYAKKKKAATRKAVATRRRKK